MFVRSGQFAAFFWVIEPINYNTKKSIVVSIFAYVLIEILAEKGIITIDELDEHKKDVAESLIKRFS